MVDEAAIRLRFEALDPVLDERSRRRFAAAEACAAGRGGIASVSRITGIARSTINRGLAELGTAASGDMASGRVRRPGGGRKKLTATDATLLSDLQALVEPTTRGDPEAPLLWTSRSLRNLATALRALGHRIGHNVVADLLRQLNYSLQANRKTREGSDSPDRDEQFGYINTQVSAALAAGEPAISVDTKKKELVGDFKNAGRELRHKGDPEPVRVHDFKIPELGRAVPYGVYDIAGNTGWVSVGIDHDTASFAVNAIRRWWQTMGRARYPTAHSLVITADCGGSNGARVRLWKRELQSSGQRTRPDHHRLSSAAWHQQMEQDRAQAVLVHHAELARQAAGQLPGHRAAHRCDHHTHRTERQKRDRHRDLSTRHQGHRSRHGSNQHHAACVPR